MTYPSPGEGKALPAGKSLEDHRGRGTHVLFDAVADHGAARAEHLLVLATTAALLTVGAAGCARGAWPNARGDVRKPNTPKTENPRCPRGTPGVSQKESGSDLLSRAVSREVPSALEGLTSVFGMGTGGTPPT